MKLMHISDLHIGKRVNQFSMIDDQKFILDQILSHALENKVDGMLIAGDVYDKTVPSVEAVDLLDEFLTNVSRHNIGIFIISGNHDSPERLNFGSRIMKNYNVHIAGEFTGKIPKVSLKDEFGFLHIYLASYLKPAVVNRKLSIQTKSFDECVNAVMNSLNVDTKERNILVCHQFVTASGISPETSESESKSLGGTDNVDYSAFDKFDYVALGHIHGPQRIGRDTVRYSGSPLKYSFSECRHNKSVTLISLEAKGFVDIKQISLLPKRDMKKVRCTIDQLQNGETLSEAEADAYVHITLTDEREVYDAIGKARAVYPNVMALEFDNIRTKERNSELGLTGDDIKEKTPLELFETFYSIQNNEEMSDFQEAILKQVFEGLRGEQY